MQPTSVHFGPDGRPIHSGRDLIITGRGQPLEFTLSFDEIPWFDALGKMRRCDWLKTTHSPEIHTGHTQSVFVQSKRCVSPRASNHGFSQNHSLSDSGWPLPDLYPNPKPPTETYVTLDCRLMILIPKAQTSNPTPCTLNPELWTLNPLPLTPNPIP